MSRDIQPGANQDDARREEDGVIDQRAQQIDPAGRHRVDRNAAQATPADTEEDRPAQPEIRDAGHEQLTMPPRRWTKTDEELDESFPASDPPGNY